MSSNLRIAIIGQSNFAADVLELILERSKFQVVGVFTIPDKGSREDVLATTAASHNIPVFKFASWRRKGVPLPEVLEQYRSVKAELNVLPFCSQFIPMEVIDGARLGSICYHPSILPRHRGASAISWTLIEGDEVAGFSIFWADDGLDTGPLLLQRQTNLEPTDTLDTIYKRFLYPEGVKAMGLAVDMVADGTAPKIVQTEVGATYDPAMFKVENQQLCLAQSAVGIFNFVRGLDSVPGAVATVVLDDGTEEQVRFFGAHLYSAGPVKDGKALKLKGLAKPAWVHEGGLLIEGTDGAFVNVRRIKRGTKMINASDWFKQAEHQPITDFSEDELAKKVQLASIWQAILKAPIEGATDFFAAGAGSMDVVRLVEEVKDAFDVPLENENVFMAPVFDEFFDQLVRNLRQGSGGAGGKQVEYKGFQLKANKRDIRVPTQLFINGEFVDAEKNRVLDIVNPTDETVLCEVACASTNDVDKAVQAAHKAFFGSWKQVSARQRGQLMLKLADLMEQYKEDLATIESVDSGAVYTLALKTHIGMSIDAWRYFAGWCDKIQGNTIPVNPARPNNVLTFTRKEPIGVCGLVTPWNYPLMMLSWKMAACIAAGNTCLIKPAQTCPLTALKFAELSVLAGFPPGVINVLPGKGSDAGQAVADHPLVRKLGFTGSTPIGKHIMKSCADSNLKKCSLELGGKSPLVIFADCDLDKAVKHGMSSVFFNKGENCIAAGRLFVEDRIHDEFVRRVLKDLRSMTIGDPLNRSTAHGPQNHKAHMDKLIEYCERGVAEGAKLVYGGCRVPNMKGYFFTPTVFTDVEDNMFIAQEESFGPIMIISKFNGSDVDSVMTRANRSEYGLASGVFTKDISKALSFADRIEAGTVFVNVYNKTDVAAPFGGFKQSGFGKDLGQEALNEYLKTKCVTIEY
ncbi:PREDICTED: cytosolic 10-formyltetrahydrofolate dehydrogenase isoform X2 [Drosophila arizonae]|uniref:10-formyltetrahydrofolate dehydrogenase n=1 Tax=Drosophila arizonae TaxID=7263 RepID=A0ABM1NWN1_DROAR|nr:PREDICTED: cytosolic 10-formyltetrahydrofolate dehydrogenase isoform X2 [Drosophila arizonae]